jgi:hypothetical protein
MRVKDQSFATPFVTEVDGDQCPRVSGRLAAMGTARTCARMPDALLLPERRTERSFPRAVKIKISNYPRKRPAKRKAPK